MSNTRILILFLLVPAKKGIPFNTKVVIKYGRYLKILVNGKKTKKKTVEKRQEDRMKKK